MANPSYMGLAGSLARARKPPAQNDVYMQQPRGTGRPPQQFGGGGMSKPGMGGPYGGGLQQGFGGGGFGSGLAGINAVPGGFGNAPPQTGGYMAGLGQLLGVPTPGGGMPGGNPGDMGGLLGNPGGGPAFGGGPQPFQSYDPLKNEKPMGGGVAMLGPPTPMQVPGFGGGPTMAKPMPLPGGGPVQTPLEDYQRRAPGRRFP